MATFQTNSERKRYFFEKDDETYPVRFERARVVITTKWGDKVVFLKTNRSDRFMDMRCPKKPLTAAEVKDELHRLLDTPEQADKAFEHLCV